MKQKKTSPGRFFAGFGLLLSLKVEEGLQDLFLTLLNARTYSHTHTDTWHLR